ncbi:hypothetical protein JOC55_002083 [Paenibacillus sacheonensis]|nr:hypothetical protein [Paenibacillus sacheonensis]
MNRPASKYLENAVLIYHSQFSEKEKIRHCRELLAHMRAEFSSELSVRNNEVVEVYNSIAFMISGQPENQFTP